jgi:hypothetical protein
MVITQNCIKMHGQQNKILHFSLTLITKANAVEGGTTWATWSCHQRNKSTHVTNGMTVTSLSASHQYKTSAVTDRLCQIALKQKLSHIVYVKSHETEN